MATQSLNNPFTDHGSIVHGDRFVGRRRELHIIQQRVLGSSFGNLAIMGLPRIGKSSLAWQGIMEKKNSLLKEKTIPIFVQVGSCNSSNSFFRQMILLLDEELCFVCDDERYKKYCESILDVINKTADMTEFFIEVQKYFKIIKRLGFKIVYILDEFDSAQFFLNVSDFQMLRELTYNPEIKICIVTCSRKTIQEIEAKNGAISNFYGTFSEIRLGMYDEESMADYWRRIPNEIHLDNTYKDSALFYVGRHPYLLDVYNDFCFRNNMPLLDSFEKLDEIRLSLWHQFKTIQETLKQENLLDKAIQLILGPTYDVTKLQEEKLLKYQFIQSANNERKLHILGRLVGPSSQGSSYICFSDYFTKLFDQEHWDAIDYWPLWTDTEKKIRSLIKIYISERYSTDWEIEMQSKYGDSQEWMKLFDSLIRTRKISKNLFPNSSNNLVDYTLTRDMYNVFMSKAWNEWFGTVFVGQRKEWAAKFNFLAEVRNPMAHNNREFVSKDQIIQATEYCNLIMRTIGKWEAQQE